MSFKNRAATAIAAGAASFALIAGIAPVATAAQSEGNVVSTNESNGGSITVPTDSSLNLRVVIVDGKPTVMISSGYSGGGSNVGSSETKPSETKPSETKPSETKPNETKPNETKPNETKPSESSEPSSDKPSDSDSKLESRSELAWIIDWVENKKDGESFTDYVKRVKKDAAENKLTEKGNDSSGIAILDTETGEIRFKLSDLLKELGISPKGVDGTESESKNKANLDELSKLIDEGSVSFNELPSFVKISGKNGVTVDTKGVKPGAYSISGTATDADGNEKPFKFEIKVDGSDESDDAKPSETEGAKPSETNKPSETKGFDDDAKSEASNNKFYENAEVRPGSSLTIKPKSDVGDLSNYVFMNAMGEEKWIEVKPDGTINIEMSDGASEGERDIYVAYVKKDDEAKAIAGDTSVMKLDRFKLNVSKNAKASDKDADASAKQDGNPVDKMKSSLTDATKKLREGAKSNGDSNKSTGLYNDVEVAIGSSKTVKPNDEKSRVFGAVLLTAEDGRPVVASDNSATKESSGELAMNDKGEITISPSGKIIKPGKYTASVITSKAGKADEFKKNVDADNFDGFMETAEVHDFSVTVTGDAADESNARDASGAAAGSGSQGGAGADTAYDAAAEQPVAQPAAQYSPQSQGSLAQTGVSLYAQLGLAASLLALAGAAAFMTRRRGFAS